jgi:DNA-directed RNA polymerase sigma subunit (sigma70/sigma32)
MKQPTRKSTRRGTGHGRPGLIADIFVGSVVMVDSSEMSKAVRRVLATLEVREEMVLRIRYFTNYTLEQTGKIFKVSKERIRQIETKALRKLRHPTRNRYFQPFIIRNPQ